MAVLLDIDDVGTTGADVPVGVSTSESNRSEVGERNEARAFFKVLDDPLGVLLAESRGRRDGLRHRLTFRVVGDDGLAGFGGGSGHGERDAVASAEGDSGEVVGVVGIPLVPS